MTISYVDVFGNTTLPPSEYGYLAVALTADNTQLYWPYDYSGAGQVVAKNMNLTSTGAYNLRLPAANQVSVGEDMLFYNTSAYTITLKDYGGSSTIATVPAGNTQYVYLTDNATATGTWTTYVFGGPVASTLVVADDTTTNATEYPMWTTGAGSGVAAKISTTKLSFNPSTGTLSMTAVAVTSTAQVSNLNASMVGGLTTTQLTTLTTAQVSALGTAQVLSISAAKFGALSTADVALLTTASIQALNAAMVGGLNTTQLTTLSTAQVSALGTAQVLSISAAKFGALSTADVAVLGTASVQALNVSHFGSLTTASFAALGTASVQALNVALLNGSAVTGSLVYLSTITASASATVDIETTFDSTYDAYLITASGVRPVDDNVALNCRLKVAGAYVTGASYRYFSSNNNSGSATFVSASVSSGDTKMVMCGGQDSGSTYAVLDFDMRLNHPSSTTLYQQLFWNGAVTRNTSEVGEVKGVGIHQNASAITLTGVRFYYDTGNVSVGTFRLYGIKNS